MRLAVALTLGLLALFDLAGCGGDACGAAVCEPQKDMATSVSCTLDRINADCAASCGTPDGGLGAAGGAGWPCKMDPLCVDGHWHFDCAP